MNKNKGDKPATSDRSTNEAKPRDGKPRDGSTPAPALSDDRRGFVTKFVAAVLSGICGLIPFAPGLAVILDPLRRKASASVFIRIATLDSVPDDGVARQFPVIADRIDAWNTYPQDGIGMVFLRREPGSEVVECVNAICPHAGCFVGFESDAKEFQCPCHDSRFSPNGARINPESCPSPRDLDTLVVDSTKLKDGEIWVEFKDFQTATPDKKAR